MALGCADYVLTEAGFGADLGFEKFMHIKTRTSQLRPHGAVLVSTVRALKFHGGVRAAQLDSPDTAAVERGMPNLRHLIGVIQSFGLPVVVALNLFPTDTAEELRLARQGSEEAGATAVECDPFTGGGAGCTNLAQALMAAVQNVPEHGVPEIDYAYELSDSPEDKVLALAKRVYNASDVSWSAAARRELRRFRDLGWGDLPILHGQDPPVHQRPSGAQRAARGLHLRGSRRAGLRGCRVHLSHRRQHRDHAGPAGPPPRLGT